MDKLTEHINTLSDNAKELGDSLKDAAKVSADKASDIGGALKEGAHKATEAVKQAPQATREQMMKTLDQCFEQAINGIRNVSDPIDVFVQSYLDQSATPEDAAKALIHNQKLKCATSGFITGFGGLLTLPVAIPAKVGSILYVQLRMITAIASIGGYDLKSPKVKAIIYACLTGKQAEKVLKGTGIKAKSYLPQDVIEAIDDNLLPKINQRVAIEVINRLRGKGLSRVGKAVPVVGGVVSGKNDYFATEKIAKKALKIFICE